MRNLLTSLALLLFACAILPAQNLIGYKANEIRDYMKQNHKDFGNQSMVYNNTFKYLKFTDRKETQTLLFFLTTDSVCKSVRLVCDKSMKENKVRELDSVYKKTSENNWTEMRNGKKYLIELKDEEWSFSVTIRQSD